MAVVLLFFLIFSSNLALNSPFDINILKRLSSSDVIDDADDEHLIHIGRVDEDSCTVDKQMNVSYSKVPLACGETYYLAGFDSEPKLVLNRANVNKFYTLVMLDPDAPSAEEPKQRSWLHWLVVNIENADVSTGFKVAEYKPPTPPKDSGLHRYIFLLIQQPEKEKEYLPYKKRGKFNINKYATDHKLGNLEGITFFKTEKSDKVKLPT